MIASVCLTGLFHLADLLLLTVMPSLVAPAEAESLIAALHLEIRWPVSLISLIMIATGVVIEAYYRDRLENKLTQTENRVATAQGCIVESEIRFRSVVEHAPNSVYCFEFDPPLAIEAPLEEQLSRSYKAVLVHCNQVFADSVAADSVDQAIGMRFGEMDSALDTTSHTQFIRDFIERGYRLTDYELKYSDPRGEPRALHLSMSGIVHDGKLHRFWGAERNVIEEFKTKAALAGRLHFHQIISEISSQLLRADDCDAEATLTRCLQQACHYVQADRATVIYFAESGHPARERFYWSKFEGVPWPTWSRYDIPWIWPKLSCAEPIGIASVDKFALVAKQDAKTLIQLGVHSIIVVPMVAAEKAVGACLFTDSRHHPEWSELDVADLRMLGNLFTAKLVQIDTVKSLEAAQSKLDIAMTRLDENNRSLLMEVRESAMR